MNQLLHGDSLEVLKTIESGSVDLLCTDPPYGYSFMGKSWDKTLPHIGIFKECLRVLKPGSFAFVMSAPRSDVCARMMLLLEDAGFEIGFTPIYWTYASGFPKAMNIGKMVDKKAGAEREIKGFAEPLGREGRKAPQGQGLPTLNSNGYDNLQPITAPATPEAKALDGSYGGFQPKPAVEVVIVAMKPLSEKTYVDQALKNGKGITWLDDCRIGASGGGTNCNNRDESGACKGHPEANGSLGGGIMRHSDQGAVQGRFPANLLVEDDVLNDHSRFFDLDAWAQTLPFLAVPKASKSEKNAGLHDLPDRASEVEHGTIGRATSVEKRREAQDGKNAATTKNHHPTVKPLKLMSYLITLGSRPGDVVLDPFLGSGTTAIAAQELGRNYIGIEREQEYYEIAQARLAAIVPTLI